MKRRALAIAVLLVAAGCADVTAIDPDREFVEKTYRTGSNIPTKSSPQADGVEVMNRDDYERFQRDMVRGLPCAAWPAPCPTTPGSH